MPFIDDLQLPITNATGSTPIPGATPAAEADAPTPPAVDTWNAAFRQGNTLGSFMSNQTLGVDNSVDDPHYSAWDDIKGTKYEPYWSSFAGAANTRYASALKSQIDQEEEDKRTLAGSGWLGTLAGVTAGVFDIPSLLPGGELLASTKGGFAVGKAALNTGVSAGAAVAAQEAALHMTQQTRTGEESAFNIGTGVVLGSILGGGASALFGKGEQKAAEGAVQSLHRGDGIPSVDQMSSPLGAPQPGGADVARQFTTGELSVDPGWAGADKIADATKAINPNLRSNFRAIPEARLYAQQLSENTLYQTMHADGDSVGPAVESIIRANYDGRLAAGTKAHDDIFSNMKKAGVNMTAEDFEGRVGAAMRTGDADVQGNGYVTQAAQSWRKNVYDPFKKEAIEQGLLPADVDVSTADSYFNRVWNRQKLVQQEGDFKAMTQQHYEGVISSDYQSSVSALMRRSDSIDGQIADMQLTPEQRTAAMGDLKAKGDALDAANGEHIDRVNSINDLRQRINTARDAEDHATVAQLQKQVDQIKADGGQGLKDYMKQRGELRGRMNRVDWSAGGLATRADSILNSLAANEDANAKALSRLVDKGRRFEREAQRLDPEIFKQRLSDLRTMFAQVSAKMDAAASRTAKTLEKLREDGYKPASKVEPKPPLSKEVDAATGEGAANNPNAAQSQDVLDRHLAQQQAFASRLNSISKRLETLENFDPQASLMEVRKGVEAMIDHVNQKSLARGEKQARLKEKLANTDPKQIEKEVKGLQQQKQDLVKDFYDKWERDHLATGVDHTNPQAKPDFREATRDIADQVFNHLTGKREDASSHPDFFVPITQGPLKDRVFNIPDSKAAPWLDDNIKYAARRYARTMSGEVELTRRFGHADMRDQFAAIQQSYRNLREQVSAAPDHKSALALIGKEPGRSDSMAAWMRGQDMQTATKERILKWLDADEKGAKTDIAGMRDLIRGTYKLDANSGNWARIVRSTMAFNYIRQMGNFIAANFTQVYRPAMVHGMRAYMGDGILPLLKNLRDVVGGPHESGFAKAVDEAKIAGIGVERHIHARFATFGEMGDPYSRGSALERTLENGSQLASKWNGMSAFFDAGRSIASVMTQNRILKGVEKGGDARYLAYLGIDKHMASRIGEFFKAHGETLDGIRVAHTEDWGDDAAVRAYRAAISKDVSSILHHKSIGDVPLFAHTPTGRLLLQFQTFNLAAHQRTMLRGMQESPRRFASGLVATTSMGMLASYLTALRGGHDSLTRFENEVKANPGRWIAEGLDKSGLFTLPFEVANRMEDFTGGAGKGFRFNPIKTTMQALGKPSTGAIEGRYGEAHDPLSALVGPSGSLISNLALTAGGGINAATGQPVERHQRKAAAGLVPFSSYYGMREMLQAIQGDSPYR